MKFFFNFKGNFKDYQVSVKILYIKIFYQHIGKNHKQIQQENCIYFTDQ